MGRKLLSVLTPDSLSLSLSDGGNVPSQPIDESTLVLSPGVLVALGARPTFVFRPGGVATGHVPAECVTMMPEVVVQQGPKWSEIDPSIAGSCHVPAGTWNVDDCTIQANLTQALFVTTVLIFDVGALLTFRQLHFKYLRLRSDSTAPVLTTTAGVQLDFQNCNIQAPTAASFIRFSVGTSLVRVWDYSTVNGSVGFQTFSTDAGVTTVVDLFGDGIVGAHALGGLGTAIVLQPADCRVNLPQDVTTLVLNLLDLASLVGFTPGVAGNWQPVPTLASAALDQLAAPNTLQEVNAAPIVAAGTITYTSVATIAKKKSGKVRISISISVTSSGIAGLDFRIYRDTVTGPNHLPPPTFAPTTVALSARVTSTLDWIDTLPDTAAHVYVMQVIADAGTVALANGDCAVVANEL